MVLSLVLDSCAPTQDVGSREYRRGQQRRRNMGGRLHSRSSTPWPLINLGKRRATEEVASEVEYVGLIIERRFQEHFLDGLHLSIPNALNKP